MTLSHRRPSPTDGTYPPMTLSHRRPSPTDGTYPPSPRGVRGLHRGSWPPSASRRATQPSAVQPRRAPRATTAN
ncbi:hypothetical protein ACFPRL_10280 [Pseudoclavibacter helvolus]